MSREFGRRYPIAFPPLFIIGWYFHQIIRQTPELEAGKSHFTSVSRTINNQDSADIFALMNGSASGGTPWFLPYDEDERYSLFYRSHPSMQSVYDYLHSTGYGRDAKKDV